ncbi:hypothetical protein ACFXA2_24350 [Micromonospora chalcea]
MARLDLVRTLRELGVDLPTVHRVASREITLAEVASAHADALTAQIRLLRTRRAVLTVIARRGATPSQADLLHRLAGLAARERRRLADEFLDAAFGGLTDPGFTGIRRSLTPELVREEVAPALAAGVEPASPGADPVLDRAAGRYARLCGRPDDADLRRRMLDRLRTARDPRRERYLELLSVVNGWPPPESLAPVLDWSIRALHARQHLA